MGNSTSVINLDPIDRKKQKEKGLIGRFLVTRYGGGKKSAPQEPFGHYMFCGKQRQGKSISVIWYMLKLVKKYRKKKLSYIDLETQKIKKYKESPKLYIYSNMGFGRAIDRKTLYDTIVNFDEHENAIRFVLIDEMPVYFKGKSKDKDGAIIADKLVGLFSQLGKRNTFLFSTAQVYGRVEKSLREQCLYMVNCKKTRSGKFINEFIDGDDIIADELGRWSGDVKFIWKHGINPKVVYDTKKIIKPI